MSSRSSRWFMITSHVFGVLQSSALGPVRKPYRYPSRVAVQLSSSAFKAILWRHWMLQIEFTSLARGRNISQSTCSAVSECFNAFTYIIVTFTLVYFTLYVESHCGDAASKQRRHWFRSGDWLQKDLYLDPAEFPWPRHIWSEMRACQSGTGSYRSWQALGPIPIPHWWYLREYWNPHNRSGRTLICAWH
jgi:hypothetical protein